MSVFKDLLDEAMEAWEGAREGYIAEVRNMTARHWDYRPTPDVRTVHEMSIHILEVAMFMAAELTRPDTNFKRKPFPQLLKMHAARAYRAKTRNEVLTLLRSQLREGQKAFRNAGELHMLQLIERFDGSKGTRLGWLHHGIAQEEYHRAQITTYARMLGIKPALTKLIGGA